MVNASELLQMLHVLVNYNFTPDWLKDKDYLIYDRSDSKDYLKDFDQSKIIYTKNIGQVDFDKLSYLIENYDSLPDVFLWGKTNLFKSITEEEFNVVKDNQFFTPLLTQGHQCYEDRFGPVCYYSGGIYHERADLLYMSNWKYFSKYSEFAHAFQIPCEFFVPFNPGGNFILTKEVVHKYSRDFYANIRSVLPYTDNPVEAHFCERAYFTLWK